MSITVCHLFDGSACWEQRVAAGQLLSRLPAARFRQVLATVHPQSLPELGPLRDQVRRIPHLRLGALVGASVSRFLAETEVNVVHAWGVDALAAAGASQLPVAVELFRPDLAALAARILRTLNRADGLAVVCGAEWVRRQLIEKGAAAAQCRVIRPGVDLALLNTARRRPVRRELGLHETDYVILLEPQGPAGDRLDALWAGALMNRLHGSVRVVAPGDVNGNLALVRFAAGLPGENVLVCPGSPYKFEELIPHANALVIASDADLSTTAVAWAMAARLPVIAAASHSVTELLAHKVGGLLYKRQPGRLNPVTLVRLLEDRDSQKKTAEAAHGMAYESFGLRRFLDQHASVYEMLVTGKGSSTNPVPIAGSAKS